MNTEVEGKDSVLMALAEASAKVLTQSFLTVTKKAVVCKNFQSEIL